LPATEKTGHIWTLLVSQGNTLLTEGFFGLSFLFNNLTLAVAFDATHYRLKRLYCHIFGLNSQAAPLMKSVPLRL